MNLATLRNWWGNVTTAGSTTLRGSTVPLATLGLPVRVVNLLASANVRAVAELASLRVSDLRKVKGLGDVYLAEIERVMVERGLWR